MNDGKVRWTYQIHFLYVTLFTKRPFMKNAHKAFLLITLVSYVILYGAMALLS